MTVAAAETLIRKAMSDPAMVQRINAAPDRSAVDRIFAGLDLKFNELEFEQAHLYLLTCCQTIEQAEAVKAIKQWWDFLQYTLGATPAE